MGKNKQTPVGSEVAVEFRGIESVYVAKVLTDNETEFTTDTPVYLSPIAQLNVTTESSLEPKYYDNKSMLVINSESADEVTITNAVYTLETLALINGRYFDKELGMLCSTQREPSYFALLYKTKDTAGNTRFVCRYKGTFSIPAESHATENDGTDSQGQEVTFTGISTTHKFTKTNGSVKHMVIDSSSSKADLSDFFDEVKTPDTITKKVSA